VYCLHVHFLLYTLLKRLVSSWAALLLGGSLRLLIYHKSKKIWIKTRVGGGEYPTGAMQPGGRGRPRATKPTCALQRGHLILLFSAFLVYWSCLRWSTGWRIKYFPRFSFNSSVSVYGTFSQLTCYNIFICQHFAPVFNADINSCD